jgi:hypothetical protein
VVQAPDHLQVLVGGQVLVHGGVLPGQADAPAHLGRLGDHVHAGDGGRAGVGRQQTSRWFLNAKTVDGMLRPPPPLGTDR